MHKASMMKPASPYSQALADFLAGRREVFFVLERSDGTEIEVPVARYFQIDHLPRLERIALSACRGRGA
jgi:hypothetical protein